MKRAWLIGLFLVAGCSTHPIVDVRDRFFPGRLTKEEVPPYGGVCRPQGPLGPPAPAVVVGPGVIPPAAPLPGPVVPPAVPLPPQTTPPPPPPAPPPGFPKL